MDMRPRGACTNYDVRHRRILVVFLGFACRNILHVFVAS